MKEKGELMAIQEQRREKRNKQERETEKHLQNRKADKESIGEGYIYRERERER